jgi:hypothetical protein
MATETSEVVAGLKNSTSSGTSETQFGGLGDWRISRTGSRRSREDSVKGEASKVRV